MVQPTEAVLIGPQLSETLSLDQDWAEHLLIHCKWNADLLVQRYTDDAESLIAAAGLKFRNPQPSSSLALTCPVCLSPQNPVSEPVQSLICMHYCCRVRTQLDEIWRVLFACVFC